MRSCAHEGYVEMLKGGSRNKYSIDVYWNKLQQDDKMFFILIKNKITLKVRPDVLKKYAASKVKEYDANKKGRIPAMP